MKRLCLTALCILLLAGCMPGAEPLLPELKGRWAPEKATRARLVLASKNSSIPITPPSIKELCATEYVTFEKHESGDFRGNVMVQRKDTRTTLFLVASVKREGARIILTGREPNHSLAGGGNTRLELILRNGEVAFDDIFDQRGRSIRYDTFKVDDPIAAQRAGLTTIGDLFRAVLDLKPCAA